VRAVDAAPPVGGTFGAVAGGNRPRRCLHFCGCFLAAPMGRPG
jgi:hypothetical protein